MPHDKVSPRPTVFSTAPYFDETTELTKGWAGSLRSNPWPKSVEGETCQPIKPDSTLAEHEGGLAAVVRATAHLHQTLLVQGCAERLFLRSYKLPTRSSQVLFSEQRK